MKKHKSVNVSFVVVHVQEESLFYIVSPKDIVVAKVSLRYSLITILLMGVVESYLLCSLSLLSSLLLKRINLNMKFVNTLRLVHIGTR